MSAEDVVGKRPPQEVVDEAEGLSKTDKARLEKAARAFAHMIDVDWEDLYHEAIARCLEGRRKCPVDVDPLIFVINEMRSIKSDEIDARNRRRELDFAEITGTIDDLFSETTPSADPTAEDILIRTQTDDAFVERVFRAFGSDETVQLVLLGIFDGLRGEELAGAAGVTVKALATIRRRIRRTIEGLEKAGAQHD